MDKKEVLDSSNLHGKKIKNNGVKRIKTSRSNVGWIRKFKSLFSFKSTEKMIEKLEDKYNSNESYETLNHLYIDAKKALSNDKKLTSEERKKLDERLILMGTCIELKNISDKVRGNIRSLTVNDVNQMERCFANLDRNPSSKAQAEYKKYLDSIFGSVLSNIHQISDDNVLSYLVEIFKNRKDLENHHYRDEFYKKLYKNDYSDILTIKGDIDSYLKDDVELSSVEYEKLSQLVEEFITKSDEMGILRQDGLKYLKLLDDKKPQKSADEINEKLQEEIDAAELIEEIESLGEYIEDDKIDEIAKNIEDFEKKYPSHSFDEKISAKIDGLKQLKEEKANVVNEPGEIAVQSLKATLVNLPEYVDDKTIDKILKDFDELTQNYPYYARFLTDEELDTINDLREVKEERIGEKVKEKEEKKEEAPVEITSTAQTSNDQSLKNIIDMLETITSLTKQSLSEIKEKNLLDSKDNLIEMLNLLNKSADTCLKQFEQREKNNKKISDKKEEEKVEKDDNYSNLREELDKLRSKEITDPVEYSHECDRLLKMVEKRKNGRSNIAELDSIEKEIIDMKNNALIKNVGSKKKSDLESMADRINSEIEILVAQKEVLEEQLFEYQRLGRTGFEVAMLEQKIKKLNIQITEYQRKIDRFVSQKKEKEYVKSNPFADKTDEQISMIGKMNTKRIKDERKVAVNLEMFTHEKIKLENLVERVEQGENIRKEIEDARLTLKQNKDQFTDYQWAQLKPYIDFLSKYVKTLPKTKKESAELVEEENTSKKSR